LRIERHIGAAEEATVGMVGVFDALEMTTKLICKSPVGFSAKIKFCICIVDVRTYLEPRV
jgi:hypothetical protein